MSFMLLVDGSGVVTEGCWRRNDLDPQICTIGNHSMHILAATSNTTFYTFNSDIIEADISFTLKLFAECIDVLGSFSADADLLIQLFAL